MLIGKDCNQSLIIYSIQNKSYPRWNLKLCSKTHPTKTRTPFKNILYFKNTTLHVQKICTISDYIVYTTYQYVQKYPNFKYCIYIPHYEITTPITNTDFNSLINIGTSCFSTLLNYKRSTLLKWQLIACYYMFSDFI